MSDRTINRLGLPTQQSLTARPEDYRGLNMSRMMLGVVLSVNPADSRANRSSYQRQDGRGYLHTATVLVIGDSRSTYLPLDNVIIPPEAPSGIDDYQERLPRGCSSLVTGEAWNNQLNHINPYDLDGDWCVVGFIGASIDSPFIVRWWPHPRNPYDPATSGSTTSGDATLIQDRRYLHRINGVEFTVTKSGNIYVSTSLANAAMRYGSDLSADEGRFPRTANTDEGGSAKVWIKPSQTFELDFNPQEDGMGILDLADDELPQTNPTERAASFSRQAKSNTYILADKNRVLISVPTNIKLNSKESILLSSDKATTLNVGSDFTLDATGDISVSTDGGLSTTILQDLDVTVTGQTNISSTGPASITGSTTVDISATTALTLSGATVAIGTASGTPGSIAADAAGLTLGTGALGGAVGGTGLLQAVTAFALAVQTAQASATVESAYAQALTAAANALVIALQAAVSTTTRVG